uniref:Uncharacterized protein n=1 Tax=Zea mays TaxID=4577 RepID=A0A804QPI7_MAIZE
MQAPRRRVQGAEVRRAPDALHPEPNAQRVGARGVARRDGAVRLGGERRAPVGRGWYGGHVALRLELAVLLMVVVMRVEARQTSVAGRRGHGGCGGRRVGRGGLRREDVDAEARGRGRRALRLEAVVLVQHVDQVLVAGDGDEHVEFLGEGEQLVLDGRDLRLEHVLHLLLQLCTGQRQTSRPAESQTAAGHAARHSAWRKRTTPTAEADGARHGEDAGLPADVLEHAVVRAGHDAAAEAAEDLDAASPTSSARAAADAGRRKMHVLICGRALGLRRRHHWRRTHRVFYLGHGVPSLESQQKQSTRRNIP